MTNYTQNLYQIVFSTKDREETLLEIGRQKLYRYIWGILISKNCTLHQINGMEDHIHLATFIHPSVALSELVKDIKVSSAAWLKEEEIVPEFNAWQLGYGAFSYSIKDKDALFKYIQNQKEQHKIKTFKEEYIELLYEHGITFEEKYLL